MGGAIGSIVGGGLSLLGANQARRAQQSALKPQEALARQQLGLFRQASPYYGQILQYLAGNAGLNPTPGQAGAGAPQPGFSTAGAAGAAPLAGAPAAIPQGALGIYGTNPADAYRFQQAQEQIDQQRRQQAQRLQYSLGQQGAGANAIASVLGRNQNAAMDQLAKFRQGLAINAGNEQTNRVQQLLGALGAGFGQGSQAGGLLGQQAALAGNQLSQAGAGIGSALDNMTLMRILMNQQRQQQAPAGPVEMDPLQLMRMLYSTPGYTG
jgi:hypothetical protein